MYEALARDREMKKETEETVKDPNNSINVES